jgi:hypothetical protein
LKEQGLVRYEMVEKLEIFESKKSLSKKRSKEGLKLGRSFQEVKKQR